MTDTIATTDGMLDLKNYLHQIANMQRACMKGKPHNGGYISVEDFVLNEGRPMAFGGIYQPAGPMKECFGNAGKIVLFDEPDSYFYCEGYAVGTLIPVLHAWVLNAENGKVYDPTWTEQEQRIYYGVSFSIEFLRWSVLKHEVWGLLGGDYKLMAQLVRGEIERQDWEDG